ncbi:outer membrane protein assembly factor BamD [Marinilabilia salmonicolor]|jgi:outer membrane protein assembly factor BamD|uniref:Beta-barrel assembly machine subunit BamD n=1 Tax=Marinilabilia salmonicolor TaxID=989 RepID=A0A2T0XPR4_9BACT|nr:outer membrane protein assembly factor BamD [Marinilabilia salmonicolor]PRZ00916.1 Beta-barrel assembly machine subunit BamD [Marinilabilia salmonicolor]RCW31035.1 Beta-barrel assembly machine subunit BamD [Marinilabilia salmonicolor]
MKKLLLLLAVVLLASCSEYQKILKSTDYDLKYEKALEYYEEGDYMRASTLLQELISVFMGTARAEEAHYKYANSLYKMRDYISSVHFFREFVKKYPNSEYAEESQFMVGANYYQMSPKPRLDQTDTQNAIESLELFLSLYPQSEMADEAVVMIEEMEEKLVYKSYLSAKLYYHLGTYMGNNYQSAVITARNSLDEFPDTEHREELSFLILDSLFIQATNSVKEKEEDRLRRTLDEYYAFINEFPESSYMKEANKIFEDVTSMLEPYNN